MSCEQCRHWQEHGHRAARGISAGKRIGLCHALPELLTVTVPMRQEDQSEDDEPELCDVRGCLITTAHDFVCPAFMPAEAQNVIEAQSQMHAWNNAMQHLIIAAELLGLDDEERALLSSLAEINHPGGPLEAQASKQWTWTFDEDEKGDNPNPNGAEDGRRWNMFDAADIMTSLAELARPLVVTITQYKRAGQFGEPLTEDQLQEIGETMSSASELAAAGDRHDWEACDAIEGTEANHDDE